jgi:uncharacterized protein YjbI with pentapeptide repeats
MANEEHLAILNQGVKTWNRWREENPKIRPDLSNADLREADLSGAKLVGSSYIVGVGSQSVNLNREYDTNEVVLIGANLRETNLSKANLRGANLIAVNFHGADFSGANLRETNLPLAHLNGANFQEADLWGANLAWAKLIKADLRKANLTRADLRKANFQGANLSRARLYRADLRKANLTRADLRKANFQEANLWGANLSKANLSGARLPKTTLCSADLRWANLNEALLSRADLSWANLREANLSRAKIHSTVFIKVDLGEAELSEAVLKSGDFRGANLSGANLKVANLSGADLGRADLRGANLSGADLSETTLVNTNFTKANLTSCSIYGISAWDLKLDGAQQSDLVISRTGEPIITVDNLEVAQFIYLLLHNEKIRQVIDTITSKVVLILGRFTEERKLILDAIRNELRQHDYLPILFDFEKPSSRDLTETISTLAHMARFIIADITEAKSIPQELERIVPDLPSVPVQPLIASSGYEYAMFEHFRNYPWVLDEYQYDSQDDLLAALEKKVIAPAEIKAKNIAASRQAAVEAEAKKSN